MKSSTRTSRTPRRSGFAGFAVVAQAADPRLTEADQALQKAEALLLASQTEGTTPQVQKESTETSAAGLGCRLRFGWSRARSG